MSFIGAQARIDAVANVGNVLGQLRTIHTYARQLIAARDLYQSGTDTVFNAAFNAIFPTASDRTELGTMIGQLETLMTDWETNHASVLEA